MGPAVVTATPNGVEIAIRVIPRARRSEIAGTRGHSLLMRLAAPPVEGAANAALIALLADRLGVPARTIQIISGEHGRDKRVAVTNITCEVVRRRLALEV